MVNTKVAMLAPSRTLHLTTAKRLRKYENEKETYQAAKGWLADLAHIVVEVAVLTELGDNAEMSDTGADTDKANDVLMAKLLQHIDLMLHLGDIQLREVLDPQFSNCDILLFNLAMGTRNKVSLAVTYFATNTSR